MGTNPLVVICFYFAMKEIWWRLFWKIIEAFNSTTRYLNDLLNIDNPYFVRMVNRIYPPELQFNKTHTSDTEAHFWICIYLFQTDLFNLKFMISAMNLVLT